MNRSQIVTEIVWLDLLAARCKAESARRRDELAADARAEFAKQGTAVQWRILDVATVSSSISHRAVVVDNDRRFAEWVARRYPTEVEMVVRPVWSADFRDRCVVADGGVVCDPDTGEVVPGLGVREGNEFGGISIRVSPTAHEVFGALAEHGLRRLALEAGPNKPVVLTDSEDGAES